MQAEIAQTEPAPHARNLVRGFLAVLRWLVAGLFLYAAVSKFADLERFRDSLDTWLLIPAAVRPGMAVLIPTLELSAALLFFGWPRLLHYMAFGVMLAGFTGFYAIHLVAYEPPDCECFLKLEAFAQWKGAVTGVIPRNLLLLAVWAVGCVPIGFRRPSDARGGSGAGAGVGHEPTA